MVESTNGNKSIKSRMINVDRIDYVDFVDEDDHKN